MESREALLDEAEIDLAFLEAQLRSRERMLSAQREGLTQRASWLDNRERRLVRNDLVGQQPAALTGLGEGRALQDADVEGYVARSATLHLGRVALLAAREEMLTRRKAMVKARREELESYEEAFAKAELRLSARERLVAHAAVQLQRELAGDAPLPPSNAKAPPAQAGTPRAMAEEMQTPPLTPMGDSQPILPPRSTKRVTATPTFRPVAQPAVVGAADSLLMGPRPDATTRPEPLRDVGPAAPQARKPSTAPIRTRVLVDSDAANVERHADTAAIESSETSSPGAAELYRLTQARGKGQSAQMLPSDLPESPPDLPQRYRGTTISVMGAMSIEDLPVARRQIEFDRPGRTILLSFEGSQPTFAKRTELLWRDRDGTQTRFAVQVRRVMPAPPRGTAVVLAPIDWLEQDYDALAAILERMP
jgi:hypothetical protein